MNNIKILRKQKGVTQAEVAKYIGISQNNFSYWENGKVKIDNDSLQKLAEYFNVTVDYLLGREENPGGTTTANAEYTEEEKQIIEDYRSLSPNLQDMIKRTLDIYTQRDTNKINQ